MDSAPYDSEAIHPALTDPATARVMAEAEALRKDQIELGLDLAEAIHSPLYKFLVSRAEHEKALAIEDFKTASVYEPAQLGEIQNRMKLGDMMVAWINNQIGIGAAAQADERRPTMNSY